MSQRFRMWEPRKGAGGFAGIITALLVACAAAVASCNRSTPEQVGAPEEEAPRLVLEEVPSGVAERDAEFGGKVQLVGYRFSGRGRMNAGRGSSVILYWKASERVEPGCELVTRLVDETGEEVVNLDDAGLLRQRKDGRLILPPETWIPGKIYVDELTFTVPENVKTWRIRLVAGVRKGKESLPVTGGTEELDGLALVATSGTGVRDPDKSRRELPTFRPRRLDETTKIRIDGKLSEAAWADAPSARLVDATSGAPGSNKLGGVVRVLWGSEGLFVGLDAEDSDVVGGFEKTEKDPQLWTRDAVRILIDPDGDGDNRDYYEIQINPQNLVFDSHYDRYNHPRKEPAGPFGNQEWSSSIKSAVAVKGTMDKSGDQDDGYVVEALLPWNAFSKAKRTPPAPGDAWRMNFYVTQHKNVVAWSPIFKFGSLHKASRFGTVLFTEPGSRRGPQQAAPRGSGRPGPSPLLPAPKPGKPTEGTP